MRAEEGWESACGYTLAIDLHCQKPELRSRLAGWLGRPSNMEGKAAVKVDCEGGKGWILQGLRQAMAEEG